MKKSLALMLVLLGMVLVSGCGNKQSKYPIKVGLSMDTLRGDRWPRDRDLFTAKCNELGMGVLVQSANSDDSLQITQAVKLTF